MTAFTLVRGAPTLAALNDDVLRDQDVLAAAARIRIESTLDDQPGHPPARLCLMRDDGEVVAEEVFQPAHLRMSESGVEAKFADCLRTAGDGAQSRAIWDAVMAGGIRRAVRATSRQLL